MAIFRNQDIPEGYWDGNQYIFKKALQPEYEAYVPAIATPSLLNPDIEPILNPMADFAGQGGDGRDNEPAGEKDSWESGKETDFSNYGQGSPTVKSGYNTGYMGNLGSLVGGPIGGLLGSGIGLASQHSQAQKDFGSPYGKPDINIGEAFLSGIPLAGWLTNSRGVLDQAADDYARKSGTGLNRGALTSFAKSGSYSGPKGVVGPQEKTMADVFAQAKSIADKERRDRGGNRGGHSGAGQQTGGFGGHERGV